ncbi:hypothetical protein IQ229_11425 [Nostoc cf. edaphicum LEGE 07299]|jgi:hypothetical protein|uniref:Uncharacterized protein n=1 Tax=Nostoc cf. edaphicum LEGE 07299 TaxID=2777974 RepID=A0ABR9TYR3_9NOSO|nr:MULTISPECIES: hypothetical protein [Nostoc]MBE9105531.1 hypothetical protein [Nostoc cf. edaphicum LEGE 07299]MDZ8084829.1 hypothetical protein [Nostoc sp. DedQUE12b]
MTALSNVIFTIALNDPELDPEEKQEIVQNLLNRLSNLEEVERVVRTEDLNPEEGSKPGISFLVGMLTAEVSVKNIKGFLGFLGDRLGDKPIKVTVEANNKKVVLEASSRQELLEAERIAKELLATVQGDSNG